MNVSDRNKKAASGKIKSGLILLIGGGGGI